MNKKRDEVIQKMLNKTKDILYTKDALSKREKVDFIIRILGEEYDF